MFNLPPSNFRQRIVNIFAGKTNEKLVPVKEETEIVNVHGFIGKPEYSKKNRGEQFFFVNNRYIKSGYLHHAVMAADEGLLSAGAQPSYFLYLEVPPHTIDINIHPTKTEIKFDDEHALYAILRSTIKHSLGQFNVAPVLDFDRDPNLDTPYQYQNKEAAYPTVQVDRSYNPFAEEKPNKAFSTGTMAYKKPEGQPNWESLYVGLKQATEEIAEMTFENDAVTSSLFEENDIEQEVKRTYQINKKYIVSPIKSGMVIIDQNRAHQRILYEEFLSNMTMNHASSQQLIFPLEMHFSSSEIALISELKSALVSTGFVFDESSTDSIIISGLPINVTEREVSIILQHLLSDLHEGIPDSSFCQNDTIAKSMSRSLAIKTGAYLTEFEQENVVNNLFACKEPNVSPFQKPTFITMRVEDLDKKFAL